MCVSKDIVDVKQLWDKNFTSFVRLAYMHHTIPVLSNSVENSILDGLPKISIFKAKLKCYNKSHKF